MRALQKTEVAQHQKLTVNEKSKNQKTVEHKISEKH